MNTEILINDSIKIINILKKEKKILSEENKKLKKEIEIIKQEYIFCNIL
jgi:hypothetical protein